MATPAEEWLSRDRHVQALAWLLRGTKVTRTKLGKRKLRLFACGCCRLIWNLLREPRSREAVEVAERFADDQASAADLDRAYRRARSRSGRSFSPEFPAAPDNTAFAMAEATTYPMAFSAAFYMTAYPLKLPSDAVLCDVLRCVFGNPFRPVPVEKSWLSWNGGTLPKLAQTIYDERAFDRLPLLADALEDVGCTNADMLGHCRGPGPHVRGCWVVDLLLGKGVSA